MDERVTRVREILGLRRLPIKIGFLDQLPAALPRWVGGPVAAGPAAGPYGPGPLRRQRARTARAMGGED